MKARKRKDIYDVYIFDGVKFKGDVLPVEACFESDLNLSNMLIKVNESCKFCGHNICKHGIIDYNTTYKIVCPGDIVVSIGKKEYAFKQDEFYENFSIVNPEGEARKTMLLLGVVDIIKRLLEANNLKPSETNSIDIRRIKDHVVSSIVNNQNIYNEILKTLPAP